MIGLTIHQRKPRSEHPSLILKPKEHYQHSTPDGITISIMNDTTKPLYLKWRI